MMSIMRSPPLVCHICSSQQLVSFSQFTEFYRVTSDSKPFNKGGALSICQKCGIIQKPINMKWHNEINTIYENYTLYFHSDTNDQLIFDQNSGGRKHRAEILLDYLLENCPDIPETGRLLDVGCGRGAFLKAFNNIYPDWSLFGCDIGERNRLEVESIPGVEAYYTQCIKDIKGEFDLVSLNHVLEHIPNPISTLKDMHKKLKPTGFLIIQVPDVTVNFFDILVADHCSHFSPGALFQLVSSCDFQVYIVSNNWLPKEITIVAKPLEYADSSPWHKEEFQQNVEASMQMITDNITWLQSTKDTAKNLVNSEKFGIFGTSIAAVWLDSELGNAARYFCDEDPGRVGNNFMGRPIIHPKDLTKSSDVFVPLVPEIANKVIARLSNASICFHTC